jgi:hypothetical protein
LVSTGRWSDLAKIGKELGLWRGVVDLRKAIEQNLGSELDMISENDLKKRIEKCAPIKYGIKISDDCLPATVTLRSAEARQKSLD